MLALVHARVRRGQALLVDAYCGAGLFAKNLADLFENVIGIEENAQAVEKARRSPRPHEEYIEGDVSDHLGEILAIHDPARTTVLLDPPATGISSRIIDLLLASAPVEIIYVSCNPATLARDLAALSGAYALKAVTPLDMFPQTAEIEVVAELLIK
jgi:tRNA/tmRNA/rRNA uracil-C5-methylase (TrmA/RlmC/RlmD family)